MTQVGNIVRTLPNLFSRDLSVRHGQFVFTSHPQTAKMMAPHKSWRALKVLLSIQQDRKGTPSFLEVSEAIISPRLSRERPEQGRSGMFTYAWLRSRKSDYTINMIRDPMCAKDIKGECVFVF